ncbi:MAG: NAD(P)H-hydrate dehydratase [Nitrospirota bacterium]
MKIATSEEMQRLDKDAQTRYGISSLILMENAGMQTVRHIEEKYGGLKKKSVVVVSGKGNNGGDGFVIARHAANRGADVSVFLLSDAKGISGDARTNLVILKKMKVPVHTGISNLKGSLSKADLIVDAIFGTGLKTDVKGIHAKTINLINNAGRPIIAVDIPSGIDADTGQIKGTAVKADTTVTFGLPKIGHFIYPGAAYSGSLKIADISIPKTLIEKSLIKTRLITKDHVKKILPARRPDAHKGDFGHVFIIAGSPGLTGAAIMAGLSALRIGAGLVTLGIPEGLNNILETRLTEIMTLPLPQTEEGTIAVSARTKIFNFLKKADAVAIGPGLSQNRETAQLVRELMREVKIPIVIDADGINALAGHADILKKARGQVIITPHPGEMARMVNSSAAEINRDRAAIARRFSEQYNVITVLKGAGTIIAEPSGDIYINSTGNPGMASGGTGDVLTGMIAGLIAQRSPSPDAAIAGVFLHGLAGDLAAKDRGEAGLIAGDVIEKIPEAIKSMKPPLPTVERESYLSPLPHGERVRVRGIRRLT